MKKDLKTIDQLLNELKTIRADVHDFHVKTERLSQLVNEAKEKILKSKMPSTGIKIYYLTKTDPAGVTTDEKTLTSSLSSNDISTGTLASGALYSITVTVTSQKTSSNTLTKTFKVARK